MTRSWSVDVDDESANAEGVEHETGFVCRMLGTVEGARRVADDGELRDQVFVPFFTTRARGTGLGLALVQRTIVDMGGTIEAGEGSLGGALFRIRLPLAGGG